MIFYLLFFYLLSESMASNCSNDSTSYDVTDKVICRFEGDVSRIDPNYDDVDPKTIPRECDIIEFVSFSINQSSMIYVNEEMLKAVTALNKPILLPLWRDECYSGWTSILGPDGNYNDAKILCDFATTYNIQGYIIYRIEPCNNETVNKDIRKYIIPYIKQLKKLCPSNFIIGVDISPFPETLKNKDIYNFEEWNNLVTFYDINTLVLNTCNPKLYNGVTPITRSQPGPNYLYSLMCITGFDNLTCCAQTSEDYYNKGKYFRELHVGIKVVCLDWDDYWNTCGCKSAFNGFYNIYAGYRGGSVIPCAKFDVQSIHYPIK